MANLYIQEYMLLGKDANSHRIQAGQEPANTNKKVAYTTATSSAAFGDQTYLVRLYADATAHVAFGDSPTATATDMILAADTAEYFAVNPGQKVSVYDGTS